MISRIRRRNTKFDRSLSLKSGDRLDGIQLSGDFSSLAYHYATISVGSPPQSFSLVVDTASALLALPCSGCATCGKTQRKFMRLESSTSHYVNCEGVDKGCDSCVKLTENGPGECAYERSYSEGSSSSGVFVKDIASFSTVTSGPTGRSSANVEMRFGCQLQADGQIAEQGVDGILGLSQGSLSMLSTMNRKGLLARNAFSLCMSSLGNGGIMTLGGVDPRLHSPIGFPGTGSTKMYISEKNGFYMLQLESLRIIKNTDQTTIQERRLIKSDLKSIQKLRGLTDVKWITADSSRNAPIPIVLDTGSTYSYLRQDVLTILLESIKKFCASTLTDANSSNSHSPCKGEIVSDHELPDQQVLCFRGLQDGWESGILQPASLEAQSLPILQFKFVDSSILDVPISRLLMRTDWTAGLHCLGLFPSSRAGGLVVLGANAMHGLDVTFDAEGESWIWSPSNCSSTIATMRTVSGTDAAFENSKLGILKPIVQPSLENSNDSSFDEKSFEALKSLAFGTGVGICATVLALIGLLVFRGLKRKGRGGEVAYSRVGRNSS